MEARTLVSLSDADGCIYNPVYRFLFLDLIDRFGDFLWAYGRKSELSKEDKESINNKFSQMVNHLNDMTELNYDNDMVLIKNFSDEEYNRLVESVLKRGAFITNNEEDKEAFVTGTINAFRGYIKKLDKNEFLKTFLYMANKPFFNQMSSLCGKEHIRKLILISGSGRQSDQLDQANSEENGTGLYSEDLENMKAIFAMKLHQFNIKCKVDHFLLDKIYGTEFFFDHTKFALLYAVLNRISCQNKNHPTTIVFREDREDIFEGLKKIFFAHPDLIPKNIKLMFWPYDGHVLQANQQSVPKEPVIIEGIGETDRNYVENVRKITNLWNPDLQAQGKVTEAIDDLLHRDVLSQFKKERILEKPSFYDKLRQAGLAVFKHGINPHSQPSVEQGNDKKSKHRFV